MKNKISQRQETLKKTILIVDDEPAARVGLSEIITAWGYTALSAGDGLEALEICATSQPQPDLIITDVFMPRLDGFRLLTAIKEQYPTIYVILLTGQGSIEDAVRAVKEEGADYYFEKPLNIRHLNIVITQCLREQHKDVRNQLIEKSTQGLKRWKKGLEETSQSLEEKRENEKKAKGNNNLNALCGSIAHNLKGEFGIIGNSISIIREVTVHLPEIQEECDLIERSVNHSQIILRRLLYYLRIGRPRLELIRVMALARKVELLVGPRLPSNISFKIIAAKKLQDQRVLTDDEQVAGVLLELIKNSANALSGVGGKIELEIKGQDDLIALTVKDNGPGIPTEIRKQLLKRQVPSKQGLGVGVFLSRKIIDSLGGTLSLQHSFKDGTAFTILLPVAKGETNI